MDMNMRICIVGGGPAGLSAGMYLEQKGYENYVIFERNDRVGGKCWSPHYNGRRYEMGAIMGVPSYYALRTSRSSAASRTTAPSSTATTRTARAT